MDGGMTTLWIRKEEDDETGETSISVINEENITIDGLKELILTSRVRYIYNFHFGGSFSSRYCKSGL